MLEVQRHVYAQEGSINKMLVDDKGLLAIAVLGLPPLPHVSQLQHSSQTHGVCLSPPA
jgi:hypothetical protein